MRIIHVADLHLGSQFTSLSPKKAKMRADEVFSTFSRLSSYAVQNGVRAVILAGDVFDGDKVGERTVKRFLSVVSGAPDVDFLFLSGNHDKKVFDYYDVSVPANLLFFGDNWRYYDYGGIIIGGIDGEGGSTRRYENTDFHGEDFNIAVMHGQVAEYATDDSAIVSLPLLKGKNIDYLALGHIHSFSRYGIDERGVAVYSGCLEGRGYDEAGEKGFVLLDIRGKDYKYTFVPFACRRVTVLEFQVSSYKDQCSLIEALSAFLSENAGQDDSVKVILTGNTAEGLSIDLSALQKRFENSFFDLKFADKTEEYFDAEKLKDDNSLKGEFYRLVAESDMDNLMKSRVIMCGIKALKGEKT